MPLKGSLVWEDASVTGGGCVCDCEIRRDWCENQDGSPQLLDYKPDYHFIPQNKALFYTLSTGKTQLFDLEYLENLNDSKKGWDNHASTPTTKRCRQSDTIHSPPDKSCYSGVNNVLLSLDNKLWTGCANSSCQSANTCQSNTLLLPSQPSLPPLLKKTRTWKKTFSICNLAAWETTFFSRYPRAHTQRQPITADHSFKNPLGHSKGHYILLNTPHRSEKPCKQLQNLNISTKTTGTTSRQTAERHCLQTWWPIPSRQMQNTIPNQKTEHARRKTAVISVDRLYIDGKLFYDKKIT